MTSQRYHNVYEDGAVCFWTSSVVEFVPILLSRTAAMRLIEIWREWRDRCGVKIVGFVVMPNHFHIAVWAKDSRQVRRFLRSSLSEASKELLMLTRNAADRGDRRAQSWFEVFERHAGSGTSAAVWKERGRAFPVTTGNGLRQKLRYMHENPVRKGLVETPEDWEFSSAAWYASGSGPLVVDWVDGW